MADNMETTGTMVAEVEKEETNETSQPIVQKLEKKPLTIRVTEVQKRKIRIGAAYKGMTIQDFILSCLKPHLDEILVPSS